MTSKQCGPLFDIKMHLLALIYNYGVDDVTTTLKKVTYMLDKTAVYVMRSVIAEGVGRCHIFYS